MRDNSDIEEEGVEARENVSEGGEGRGGVKCF